MEKRACLRGHREALRWVADVSILLEAALTVTPVVRPFRMAKVVGQTSCRTGGFVLDAPIHRWFVLRDAGPARLAVIPGAIDRA